VERPGEVCTPGMIPALASYGTLSIRKDGEAR
jgi:hypothetical protein